MWQYDRVEITANDQGNRTTPSYVVFTDTERLIGDAAKNQVAMNPLNTVFAKTEPRERPMAEAVNGSSPSDLEALRRLTSAEPFLFLNPDSDLSQSARCGSRYIFSSLAPLCPKSPFDRLLLDGFDAEQIWQQIDLQTQHLIPGLRRKLNHFKRNPEQISKFLAGPKVEDRQAEEGKANDENEREDFEDVENLEVSDEEDDAEEREDRDNEEEGEDDEEEEGDGVRDVEDQFLKIKELERYLEKDERKEYGGEDEGNDEDDEEDNAEVDEDEDVSGDDGDDIRYEDFFGSKEKGRTKKKGQGGKLHDLDTNDDESVDHNLDKQSEKVISTHEKRLEKMRLKIEQMEKANLEPKTWTMQGEVTAAKRPKNSALEVDLDFEHNVRPAPVITKEVTESLEDLIKKRIIEGHFDDVQKPPRLTSTAPKVHKELDENKSKKGLAEIYEEEYAQKTGLASAPLLYTDEQKKEASLLFRRLCLKLDALSHFHFAPKPVIEDMSIQSNIPALAMEEIAPLAVSDAAMLAPEEVFSGKGDIKEDVELTHEERKRRRANKKRKFKANRPQHSAPKKSNTQED